MRKIWLLILFACSLFACSWCHAEGADVQKYVDPKALYLTWQQHPESTMTISWITAMDQPADLIEYRRMEEETTQEQKIEKQTTNDFWLSATGTHAVLPQKAPYFLHRVELTGLLPDTAYLFRTASNGISYKFKTMPLNISSDIRFVVGGDMFQSSVEILAKTNREAAKTNPRFVLIGGDIAYASGSKTNFLKILTNQNATQTFDRWLTWLQTWKNTMVTSEGYLIPMIPTIGNHEVDGGFDQTPEQAPFFYALFPMPGSEGYQVLDFNQYMSVFLLDSGHTHPIGGKQTAWLATALKTREQVLNKFALYHVPAYPSVRSLADRISTEIRKCWIPLFDRYFLSIAFENHDHNYKRTFPILNGKIDPSGVLYIGDGAWGVDPVRESKDVKQKWYLKSHASARHFLLVTLSPNHRSVAAITADGTTIDQVTQPTL